MKFEQIGRRAAERLKRPLSTIDFGGGLGIRYFPHEQDLDMAQLREELSLSIAHARPQQSRHRKRAEPEFVIGIQ